jgi:uncharacterized protein YggU (UPF0235/DUF167 family)
MNHDRINIAVHVHPGARHPGVGGSHGDSLVVRVAPRAVEGAANDEVLVALARAFGLRRHQVSFVRIARSRDKLVELRGDASALRLRYDELRRTSE